MIRQLQETIAAQRAKVKQFLDELPFWPDVVRVSEVIAAPLVRFASSVLTAVPALRRAEWLLGIESLTKRHPVALAFSLVFILIRGLLPTPNGHIGTDRLVYPFLAAVSGFNPFLGLVCGALYGVGDIAQKLLWNDIYGTNMGVGRLADPNYWGAVAGYVIAYSAVMLAGVLPGMVARICRHGAGMLARRYFFRRAAAHADGASPASGADDRVATAEVLAAAIGAGAAAGFLVGEVAPEMEKPAFYGLRPKPDVSCWRQEVSILGNQAPAVAIAGGAGGAGTALGGDRKPGQPPPKEPRDYEGRDNPWDPSKEKQREMWETRGVVWDPKTLEWREPRPDEIPKPEDFPEKLPPIAKQIDRNKIPHQCVALFDEYVIAQSDFLTLGNEVKAAEQEYSASNLHYLRQLMKFMLKMSWDVADTTAGGVQSIHHAGSGVGKAPKTPASTKPGKISQALRAVREKLARLTQQIASLTEETGILRNQAQRLAKAVDGIKQAAESAAARVRNLKDMVQDMQERARRLASLDERWTKAAKTLEEAETARTAARKKLKDLTDLRHRMNQAAQAWDYWKRTDDALQEAHNAQTGSLTAHLDAQREMARARVARVESMNTRINRLTAEIADLEMDDPRRPVLQQEANALFERRNAFERELQPWAEMTNQFDQAVSHRDASWREGVISQMSQRNPPIPEMQRYVETARDLHLAEVQLAHANQNMAQATKNLQYWENQGMGRVTKADLQRNTDATLKAQQTLNDATGSWRKASQEVAAIDAERDPLKRRVEAEETELRSRRHELEGAEKRLERAKSDLAASQEELSDVQHKMSLKESELEDAKKFKESLERDAMDLELREGVGDEAGEAPGTSGPGDSGGPGYPLSGPGDGHKKPPTGGPQADSASDDGGQKLSERLKPGIVKDFEDGVGKVLGAYGEAHAWAFGSQSPDEMAKILRNCQDVMERDLQSFLAKQSQLEAARQAMSDLKPRLDRCIEENARLEDFE